MKPIIQPDHVDILIAIVSGLLVMIVLMATIIGYFISKSLENNSDVIQKLTDAIESMKGEFIAFREHNQAALQSISDDHKSYDEQIACLTEVAQTHDTRISVLEHDCEKNHR